MKGALAYVAATVVGLVLFAMPFLWYGLGGGHSHAAAPHSDHGARHGGHLLMLYDYHLELVEHDDSVELYLSDVSRRPLRPDSCEVAFDGRPPTPCEWRSHRSVVAKPIGARMGIYQVWVGEGPPLMLKFP
jgi:hypothetical protein